MSSHIYAPAHERGTHDLLAELRAAASAATPAVDSIAEMIGDGDLRSLDRLERLAEWSVGIGRLSMQLRESIVRKMQLAARAASADGN